VKKLTGRLELVACRLFVVKLSRCLAWRLSAGLMLCSCAMGTGAVAADDELIEQAQYVITQGEAVPSSDARWRALQPGKGLGFVDGAVWLRLKFISAMPKDENFWLLIRPIHIDHITVYRNSLTPIERVSLATAQE
jgi:7TMR-DISM extracellular 2.